MSLLTSSTAVRSGFAALRSNPLRTALSALGVIIGIGAMISVLALSDGVETSIRKQLAADGRMLTLRLSPRTSDMVDGVAMPRASAPHFTVVEVGALRGALGPLGTVDLNVFGQGFVTVAPGHKARGMTLRGTSLPPVALREHPPVAGRFFTSAEVASRAHVLVLSDGLAAALAETLADSTAGPVASPIPFGRGSASVEPPAPRGRRPTAAACRALVGRTVTVRDTPWQIIGVLAPAEEATTECTGAPPLPRGRAAGFQRLTAYLPASAIDDAVMAAPLGAPPGVVSMQAPATMIAMANRIEDVPAMRTATEQWLASRYGAPKGTAGGWKDDVDVASYERESESIRQGMLIFRLLMSAITGISLVVGGVGIMNVLLASVTERTREIGISKAVGARRRDVLAQYLAESVAIAAMGAVLGTILGYGVAQVVAAVMRKQATIPVHAGFSASTLLVAVGAPLVVGVCFGMYPAMRASRLSPIDAIRHE